MTGVMKEKFVFGEHIADMLDTGKHIILSLDDFEFLMGTDTGDKTGRRRVNNNAFNREGTGQEFESSIMFFIGFLNAFFAGIVVIFFDSVPDAVRFAPESDRSGVNRAVVTGKDITGKRIGKNMNDMLFLIKHRIDNAFGDCPFSENESVIEYTCIHALIAFFDFRGKRGVVVHSEMEIESIFGIFFQNPFLIEPMVRVFGVAVKPELRTGERASCNSLFHKRTGHKNDFIKEDTAERHALNHRSRAFIFAAEEIKAVSNSDSCNIKIMFAEGFFDMKAGILKEKDERTDEVAFSRCDSFAADCKRSVLKMCHCPADETEGHGKCFAASDSPVTDNGIKMTVIRQSPPLESESLFLGESIKQQGHQLRNRKVLSEGFQKFCRSDWRGHIRRVFREPFVCRRTGLPRRRL